MAPAATGNRSRRTVLTYPDGWKLETTYGTSGSIDDRTSRTRDLRDAVTDDVFAQYDWIGTGLPAIVEYGIPEVTLNRFLAHNGTTTTGDSQIELPAECLNVSGTTTTCDRLGGALQALGYATVSCVNAASGGGCTCSATAAQTGGLAMLAFGAASSGMYSTASELVTTSTPTGSITDYAYCVSGDRMVMTPRTAGKTGALTGTIVFVKPSP